MTYLTMPENQVYQVDPSDVIMLSGKMNNWRPTNHDDKGADDDIAAANELLEASRVDLTVKDSTKNQGQIQRKTQN